MRAVDRICLCEYQVLYQADKHKYKDSFFVYHTSVCNRCNNLFKIGDPLSVNCFRVQVYLGSIQIRYQKRTYRPMLKTKIEYL